VTEDEFLSKISILCKVFSSPVSRNCYNFQLYTRDAKFWAVDAEERNYTANHAISRPPRQELENRIYMELSWQVRKFCSCLGSGACDWEALSYQI
jgi:hypothetical protein